MMKNWLEYLFMILGAACIILSSCRLFQNDDYFNNIIGIIVGIGLIKAMWDKIQRSRESKQN